MFCSKSITLKSIASLIGIAIFMNISTPALVMAMDKDDAIEMGEVGKGGKGLPDPGIADPGVIDDALAGPAALVSPWWLGLPITTTLMFLATTIVFIILWQKDPQNCPNITDTNNTCYEFVKQITECVLQPQCFVNQAQLPK